MNAKRINQGKSSLTTKSVKMFFVNKIKVIIFLRVLIEKISIKIKPVILILKFLVNTDINLHLTSSLIGVANMPDTDNELSTTENRCQSL